MIKIIDQPFVPMVENTPPIDNRFVYQTLKEFKDAAPLHYEGCISYIKDSDTYIQTGKDGYCQVMTYRVGIMDIEEFVNFTAQNYSSFFEGSILGYVQEGNCKISIFSGKDDGYSSYETQEQKNLKFYNKYMLGYDILLDFTNNIFAYKYVKNANSKNGEKNNYTLDDLYIKFAALNHNYDNKFAIYDKLKSAFLDAYNSLSSVNDVDGLKSCLSSVFDNLRQLEYPSKTSNTKLIKTYNDFRNETTGDASSSTSSSSIDYGDHL